LVGTLEHKKKPWNEKYPGLYVDCVFAPVAFLLAFFGSIFGVVWEFMVPALLSVDCISLLFGGVIYKICCLKKKRIGFFFRSRVLCSVHVDVGDRHDIDYFQLVRLLNYYRY
jgi:hypothetical protein